MTGSFDLTRYQDPLTIQRVLYGAKTIAIVGLSSNTLRASYFVGYYLQRHGFRVIPVNPRETEILGEKSYPSLRDVPEPVEMVDVFRRPEFVAGVVDDALAIGAKILWLQLGVIDVAAAERARAAGLTVVMDRCPAIEYRRLF